MTEEIKAPEPTKAVEGQGQQTPQKPTSSATQTGEKNPLFLDKKALVRDILGEKPAPTEEVTPPVGNEADPQVDPNDTILDDLGLQADETEPGQPPVAPAPEQTPAPEANSEYISRIEKQAVENADLRSKLEALEVEKQKRAADQEVDFVDAFLELTPDEIESRFQTKGKDDDGQDVMIPALNGTQAKIIAQIIKTHVKKALSGITPAVDKINGTFAHQEKTAALVKANPGLVENEALVMKAIQRKHPQGVPNTVDRYQLIQDVYQQIVNAKAAREAGDLAQGKRTLSSRQASAPTATQGPPPAKPRRWVTQLAADMVSGK